MLFYKKLVFYDTLNTFTTSCNYYNKTTQTPLFLLSKITWHALSLLRIAPQRGAVVVVGHDGVAPLRGRRRLLPAGGAVARPDGHLALVVHVLHVGVRPALAPELGAGAV